MAESVGNMREVSKLTRILGHKDRRGSCTPSKGADGRTITTSTQLLSKLEKFLGTKFQRPAADAHQNVESLPAEDGVLDDDELPASRLYVAGMLRDGMMCQPNVALWGELNRSLLILYEGYP